MELLLRAGAFQFEALQVVCREWVIFVSKINGLFYQLWQPCWMLKPPLRYGYLVDQVTTVPPPTNNEELVANGTYWTMLILAESLARG